MHIMINDHIFFLDAKYSMVVFLFPTSDFLDLRLITYNVSEKFRKYHKEKYIFCTICRCCFFLVLHKKS
jgi:hypothetical protein